MSLPGEKAFSPAPRTITQRMLSSADSSFTAAPRSRHIALVSALRFAGRLRITVAMAPSRATSISPSMGCSTIEEVDETEPGDGHVGDEQQHGQQHRDEPDIHARN